MAIVYICEYFFFLYIVCYVVEEGCIWCEDYFPFQMYHASVKKKKKNKERASKVALLFPVLWHGNSVKGGWEKGRQNLHVFQNQQTYKIIQGS